MQLQKQIDELKTLIDKKEKLTEHIAGFRVTEEDCQISMVLSNKSQLFVEIEDQEHCVSMSLETFELFARKVKEFME